MVFGGFFGPLFGPLGDPGPSYGYASAPQQVANMQQQQAIARQQAMRGGPVQNGLGAAMQAQQLNAQTLASQMMTTNSSGSTWTTSTSTSNVFYYTDYDYAQQAHRIRMDADSLIAALEDQGFAVTKGEGKQITYRPHTQRAFNRFINASDLLAAFIKHLGTMGIKQDQFLNLPIELFINWLVVQAAEADGDPLPDFAFNPRCKECGRFIPNARAKAGVLLCEPHLLIFMGKQKAIA